MTFKIMCFFLFSVIFFLLLFNKYRCTRKTFTLTYFVVCLLSHLASVRCTAQTSHTVMIRAEASTHLICCYQITSKVIFPVGIETFRYNMMSPFFLSHAAPARPRPRELVRTYYTISIFHFHRQIILKF